MASKYPYYDLPSSFIFLLFISISFFITCHEAYDLSKVTIDGDDSPTTTSPFDFLKNLNGTHKGDQAKELVTLKKYLQDLGYINTTDPQIPKEDLNSDVFDGTLESAIKLYQQFFSLNVTGTLDEETLNMMLTPRCGMPDVVYPDMNLTSLFANNQTLNSSLYTLTKYRWPANKRRLTYSFAPLTRADSFDPIKAALSVWQSNSNFQFIFTQDHTSADLKISFQKGAHGDKYPFDGKNGVIAHAFYPKDGRIHFDADENWITGDDKRGDYYVQFVATHQIGHALGLGHSRDKGAVMAPNLGKGENRPLALDDYYAINAMYPN